MRRFVWPLELTLIGLGLPGVCLRGRPNRRPPSLWSNVR